MKKTFLLMGMACTALVLWGCKGAQGDHLLQGNIKLEGEHEIALNYTPDGSIMHADAKFIVPDSVTGDYSLDVELDSTGDYEFIIDSQVYGVFLDKEHPLTLNISQKGEDGFDLDFEGENEDLCRFVSLMYNRFDLMKYSPQDPAEQKSNDYYCQLLEKNHQEVVDALSDIRDEARRAYYAQKTEYEYIGLKLMLLGDKAYETKQDAKEWPEYKELLAKIDPNSELAVSTNLIFRWIFGSVDMRSTDGDLSGECIAVMDLVDSKVTRRQTRELIAGYLPQYFFTYGDHETGVEAFCKRYAEFAKDYPDMIKACQQESTKKIADMTGQTLPAIELTTPEGGKQQLLELAGNAKVTYVDCWATWCGPCCREIPFLDKLVEKMKGNREVQFVSVSMDTDLDAWKAKLKNDNPAWPQFVLDEANNKTLSEALNITGIPRFFVLDSTGKVIDQDARRPSDEDIEQYLEGLCK